MMDLKMKLLLAVGVSGTAALLCGVALVLQSTEVIDLTKYFPTLHPEQPVTAAGTGTAETPQEPAAAPEGDEGGTGGKGKGGAVDIAGGGKGGSAEPHTPTVIVGGESTAPIRELGPIGTVVGTLPESPTGNPGSVSTTVVKLTDDAMEWAQPGRYPKIGDRIGINLPPDGKRFVIKVVYFEERADGSGLDLYGNLEELGSSVLMMTVGNKLTLRITDHANNRMYYVFAVAGSDEYVIEEWDLSKQPRATEYEHP